MGARLQAIQVKMQAAFSFKNYSVNRYKSQLQKFEVTAYEDLQVIYWYFSRENNASKQTESPLIPVPSDGGSTTGKCRQ